MSLYTTSFSRITALAALIAVPALTLFAPSGGGNIAQYPVGTVICYGTPAEALKCLTQATSGDVSSYDIQVTNADEEFVRYVIIPR